MTMTFDLMVQLHRLEEDYTFRVNEFIAEDRLDLAEQLAAEYARECARLLRTQV